MISPNATQTNSGKNLLILIDDDFVGGAETNYRFILPELERLGWTARFMACGQDNLKAYFSRQGIEVEVLPWFGRYHSFSPGGRISPVNIWKTGRVVKKNIKSVMRAVEQFHPAAIISNSMVSHWMLGRLSARQPRSFATVMHLHDIINRRKAKGLYGYGLDWITARVDRVITVSEPVGERLNPRDREKIHKIYNPVSTDSSPVPEKGSRMRVGMFARYTPWKGHRDLLTIAKACADADIEFVCFGNFSAGDAAYFEELTRTAAALPNADRVRLNRFTPSVYGEMKQCDVILQLSNQPDPAPRILYESNACGVPVYSYRDGGGAVELFRELKLAGKLFERGDTGAVVDALKSFDAGDYQIPDLSIISPEVYTRRFLEVATGGAFN